jgi:1-acyl-sn-glycerol-3-phosphate acyltransferase
MDVLKSIIVWFLGVCYIGILFPLTFIIWVLVLPFDRKGVVVHWVLVYQALVLTRLMPIWRMDIEGRDKALKGETYVIISNHQSILDTLLLNCLRYRFKWTSKIENTKVPVLGCYIRMAGYFTVNRNDEESKAELLEKSLRCLKSGTSVMLFPEGTRSTDSEIGFFKRGAFQLAIQAGVPVLPVLIDGTGGILPKNGLIFGGGHRIRMKVLDPVLPADFKTEKPEELALKFSSLMKLELRKLRDNTFA